MKVQESPLRDLLRLVMWYPVRWVICRLPVPWGIRALRCLGDIHYGFARKTRKGLEKKIAAMIPGTLDPARAAREYYRNHYVDQLFILIFPKLTPGKIRRLVEIEGEAHLKKCLEQGKGAVLVHGHFGPALLPLVVLAVQGYPIMQIGNPSDEGLSRIGRLVAYRLRMKYEGMMPARVVKVNDFLRPVFKALKDNGVIMTTGDGSGTGKTFGRQCRVPFLGKIREMPLGPALLAKKTGAGLLPLFVVPGDRKMFRILIEKPLPVIRGAAGENDTGIMKQFLARYEEYIGAYPGYLHFLDRMEV